MLLKEEKQAYKKERKTPEALQKREIIIKTLIGSPIPKWGAIKITHMKNV